MSLRGVSSLATGGGGGGTVSSVFSRTGAVTAQTGDYTSDQVTQGSTNLYTNTSQNLTDLRGITFAKGDLITSNGTNLTKLILGLVDGAVLTVDSSQTLGMRWLLPLSTYDATVGVGGQYASVTAALAAGKTSIAIVGDATEPGNITVDFAQIDIAPSATWDMSNYQIFLSGTTNKIVMNAYGNIVWTPTSSKAFVDGSLVPFQGQFVRGIFNMDMSGATANNCILYSSLVSAASSGITILQMPDQIGCGINFDSNLIVIESAIIAFVANNASTQRYNCLQATTTKSGCPIPAVILVNDFDQTNPVINITVGAINYVHFLDLGNGNTVNLSIGEFLGGFSNYNNGVFNINVTANGAKICNGNTNGGDINVAGFNNVVIFDVNCDSVLNSNSTTTLDIVKRTGDTLPVISNTDVTNRLAFNVGQTLTTTQVQFASYNGKYIPMLLDSARDLISWVSGDIVYSLDDDKVKKYDGVDWNDVNLGSGAGSGMDLVTSPTANDILLTNGSGQAIDSGKAFSTDGTLSANSDNLIPTQKAVKTAITDAALSSPLNFVSALSDSNFSAAYSNGVAGVGATLIAVAPGVVTFDGYSPSLNEDIWFNGQSSTFQNGAYRLTTLGTLVVAAIFTRRTDYDSSSEMTAARGFPVKNGTNYGSTFWLTDTNVSTVGTDPISATELTVDLSGVLQSANNLSDLASATTARSNLGLGNVTNDAQLKRSANDFTSFTLKTTPVASDVILIEDSESSGVKKYTTASKIPITFSKLSNALATNTLDNGLFAQEWDWSTATTQTALTLAATSITSGALLSLSSGSGNALVINSVGRGIVSPAATGLTVSSGTTGTATFDSQTSGNVDVGTGATSKNVTLGNLTGTTSTSILAGSTGVAITTASSGPINISANGSGAVTLDSVTGNVNVGTSANGKTITVGNTTGSTGIIERVGTGNFSLDGVGASTYSIGASTTGGTISIGGTAQTGAINIAPGTSAQTINIANNTGVKTINVGNGTSGNALNLLNGNASNTLLIGNSSGSLTGTAHLGTAGILTIDSSKATGNSVVIQNDSLTSGAIASITSTSTGATGNLLNVTSGSTSAFTNGGVRLNYTGDYTGNGLQIDGVYTNGCGLSINQTTNSYTGAGLLQVASTAVTTGTVAAIAGPSATDGTILQVSGGGSNTSSTGTVLSVVGGTMTTGCALRVDQTVGAYVGSGLVKMSSVATTGTLCLLTAGSLTSGRALALTGGGANMLAAGNVFSVSMGAATVGTGISVTTTGAYTGTGVIKLTADTATTGTLAAISANAITTGTALDITSSSGSINSTNGLFRVANTGATTTGILARLQSSSASESGITLLANGNTGFGETTPTALVTIAAGTTATAPFQLTSGTNTTAVVNGSLEYNGTNYFLSQGGVRYTVAKMLTTTATLNFPSTTPGNASDLTITVTGAALSDLVVLGIPDSSTLPNTAAGTFDYWVSAANTVNIRFTNAQGLGSLDPPSGSFRVAVIKVT